MAHFNTARTIDLGEYLPDILKGTREMEAIMEAETPEVAAIWAGCEDLMNDQFIWEATENGVARREKMLGVSPFATDTLADRKFRVLSRYNENIPYTRRSLMRQLATLCGEDGYSIQFLTKDFTVKVKVALTARKQEAAVGEMLERILPYNMAFTVELMYNQWQKVAAYTWGEVNKFTWNQLREEVL